MKILVINCGSSSLKYQLIDSDSEQVLAKGLCERIGIDGAITHQAGEGEKVKEDYAMPDHDAAVKVVIEKLTDSTVGAVASLSEIGAVGHRVVHGGERFANSVLINEEVISAIEAVSDLAPLHNPANLIGIRACEKLMPGVPQVVVFDTAFHQTMPEKAYIYGLPYEYYEKYGVRRYGFHGTSHSFVSKRTAALLEKPVEDTKIVVCHLGNGSSICAVKGGKSVDTTMGLTPLAGVPMGTRSGDIDPAIVEFVAQKEGLDLAGVMSVLNKKSGMLGVSGKSSDFRDLDKGMSEGDDRCRIAMEVFSYQVAKYVGAYAAAMNGIDAIAFTAGVGENQSTIRRMVCEHLEFLGITLNAEENAKRGEELLISTAESKVKVFIVPTNEELAIAQETLALTAK